MENKEDGGDKSGLQKKRKASPIPGVKLTVTC